MRTKRLLIALPVGILAVLLQSALWVPTYESQAKGNPGRLTTFVRASVGDPKTLAFTGCTLLEISVLAATGPALRAALTDPAKVLRRE